MTGEPASTFAQRSALEDRIGHRFADPALLSEALMHRSAARGSGGRSNERLEFLGDRVLGLAIADALWRAFPESDEGALTRRLVALVRAETLAEVAHEWELGRHLTLAPGDRSDGGERRSSTLGDAVEAVLGAIYLDAGFAAAAAVVERHFADRLRQVQIVPRDAKTTLQEWSLGRGLGLPVYRILGRTGPDHAPEFTVDVTVTGFSAQRATGASKQAAQQAAAQALLRALEAS